MSVPCNDCRGTKPKSGVGAVKLVVSRLQKFVIWWQLYFATWCNYSNDGICGVNFPDCTYVYCYYSQHREKGLPLKCIACNSRMAVYSISSKTEQRSSNFSQWYYLVTYFFYWFFLKLWILWTIPKLPTSLLLNQKRTFSQTQFHKFLWGYLTMRLGAQIEK